MANHNRYDHRLRDLVRSTGNIDIALQHGVPRSTARGWMKSAPAKVVTLDVLGMNNVELQQEVLRLRARVSKLMALFRVLIVVLRISGYSLNQARVPDGKDKVRLIKSIGRMRDYVPLKTILRHIHLSPARYHSWNRKEKCQLDDLPSCPRVSPHQLTASEVETIHELVTSDEHRHVPTGTLAIFAQRMGKVFASRSTWYRLVRENGWRRPRTRVHPAKPKVGIRAEMPNEIWHVDTTVIRLLDGRRAYLNAVIDNFSRRILAWTVNERFDPGATAEVLLAASTSSLESTPSVMVDGGVENRGPVDALEDSGKLKRILAMTDVRQSNSMIESWWRILKHQWLFLNPLDSVKTTENLVAFYVQEHNTRLPHSAFNGQTPDEMYFRTGNKIPEELEDARKKAREAREQANRSRTCRTCESFAVGV